MMGRISQQLEAQQRAIEKAEDLDFKRDDMVQSRIIELAKIGQGALNDRIKQEQDASQPKTPDTGGGPRPQAVGE